MATNPTRGSGPPPDDRDVEAPLTAWRYKATNALTVVGAVVYLPSITLWLAGHGPPVAWPIRALALVTYLTTVAGAVMRRVDHRARVGALLGAGYLLSLLAGRAFPQGPFLRSLPLPLSVLALVLIGPRAGRIATVVGVIVLMCGPFLRTVPGVGQVVAIAPAPALAKSGLLLTQGFALAATLVGVMVLLERFHLNLLHALAAESRSATELSNEMTRRRRLEREIARIADEERRRLGQDIHDGVCQLLTGALLRCQAMERRLDRGAALAPSDLSELSSVLEEGIDEAHAVAKGLCPLEPEPGALVQALRTLAKRTSGPVDVLCEFITSGDTAVTDPSTADHLYRIAQEAVSNAVRHAKAGRITLELRGCEDALVLRVQDNGVGLSSDIPPGGMGLGTMAYRAQAMGGDIRVERAPVGGTRAICRVPRVTHAQTRERQRHSVEGNDGA